MPVGRKVFLAVVLSQLLTIALILGWYFYTLRSELDSITRQRAQDAVLQSIAATEDYFKPAEMTVEAGQLLLSDHILDLDKPDPLERYFFEQLRLRPLLAGLYLGNPAGEFFYVMRNNEKEGGTRTKVIRNGPSGREVELTWRRPDYTIFNSERDPQDNYDPRTRGWYRSAVERRGRVWTEPYIFFTSRKPGITLASPIIGKDSTVEAVLGADIEISEISRSLGRTSGLLQGRSVYISTSDGKVIAHSTAGVVLPDSAAGDNGVRFRQISELPGIEGTAAKQLSELTGKGSANAWEAEADGQRYFVAVGQMSNIDSPWQLVVTVPKTRQLEPASESTIILIGVLGLATLLACAIGYAMSRAIGGPVTQLLENAQLARSGNIELMEDVRTGSREIDEIGEILKEFAMYRRGKGPLATTASSGERSSSG